MERRINVHCWRTLNVRKCVWVGEVGEKEEFQEGMGVEHLEFQGHWSKMFQIGVGVLGGGGVWEKKMFLPYSLGKTL